MSKIKTYIILFIFIFIPLVSHSTPIPKDEAVIADSNRAVTVTESGRVKGYIHKGTYIFKGIPYAKAERFMPPEKPDSWEGVRSCLSWGPICPQNTEYMPKLDEIQFLFNYRQGYMDEDCQRLNIWTPKIKDLKKRPVMVWIHGGGYMFGSSEDFTFYDGEQLSKKGNIVIVSLNHRLNVLGFANLSSFGKKYGYSANAGIMDLVAALEWIKNNISGFGGDPDNITIFGQSGGGGKVGTIMNAPSAQGLFHKAIIQSGADPKFQDNEITARIGKALVKELGLSLSDIDKIQEIPYQELSAAGDRAVNKIRKALTDKGKEPNGFGFGFSPTLDHRFIPYKPDHPKALAISANIPLMIGSLKNETLTSLWNNPPLKDRSEKTVIGFIKNKYGKKADAYINAVKKAYPKDSDPKDLIDVDIMFRKASVKHANLKSEHSKAPVFMYLFTWQSPIMDGKYKSMHCMEIPFVFNNIQFAENMTGGGKDAYALAHKISTAWIHFAYHGNPNHRGLPKWPAYTEKNGAAMFFDNTCSVQSHHDKLLLEVTKGGPNLW